MAEKISEVLSCYNSSPEEYLLTETQLSVSQLFQSFCKQVTDKDMICGMMVGGMLGTATKAYTARYLSSFSFFQKSNFGMVGAQGISLVASCMTEAFGMHSLPAYLRGEPTVEGKFGEGWRGYTHTTLTIMMMKMTGCILPKDNMILQHLGQDVLMVALDSGCAIAGLTEATEGSFWKKVCENEVVSWQMMASGCLAKQFFPSVAIFEAKQSLNYDISGIGKGWLKAFGLSGHPVRSVVTPEGIVLSVAEKSGGKEAEAEKTQVRSSGLDDWHGISLESSGGGKAVLSERPSLEVTAVEPPLSAVESEVTQALEVLRDNKRPDALKRILEITQLPPQETEQALSASERFIQDQVGNLIFLRDHPEVTREMLAGRTDFTHPQFHLLRETLNPGHGVLFAPNMKDVWVGNRGEIAVGAADAMADLGIQGHFPVPYVERNANWVRRIEKMGGRIIIIGGKDPKQAYFDAYSNIPLVVEHAQKAGADAFFPGYGYLSEKDAAAEALIQAGIAFIGPSPHSLRLGGDKVQAKEAMRLEDIAVIPGPRESFTDFQRIVAVLGPMIARGELILPGRAKCKDSGGGRDQYPFHALQALGDKFPGYQRASRVSCQSDAFLIEQQIDRSKHREVQVIADGYGYIIVLYDRECTSQKYTYQKTIEEAGSPYSRYHGDRFPERRAEMLKMGFRAARALRYTGAGTVEFLDTLTQILALEVNTRIQVENEVSKYTSIDRRNGRFYDIIREMFRIAQGYPISRRQRDIEQRGAAVEVRVKAVRPFIRDSKTGLIVPDLQKSKLGDPLETVSSGQMTNLAVQFRGQRITDLNALEVDGIYPRWSIGVGDVQSDQVDAMIMKCISVGDNRAQALERTAEFLQGLIIEGVDTDAAQQLAWIRSRAMRLGRIDNSSLPRFIRIGGEDYSCFGHLEAIPIVRKNGGLIHLEIGSFVPLEPVLLKRLEKSFHALLDGNSGEGEEALKGPLAIRCQKDPSLLQKLGTGEEGKSQKLWAQVDEDGRLLNVVLFEQNRPRQILTSQVSLPPSQIPEGSLEITFIKEGGGVIPIASIYDHQGKPLCYQMRGVSVPEIKSEERAANHSSHASVFDYFQDTQNPAYLFLSDAKVPLLRELAFRVDLYPTLHQMALQVRDRLGNQLIALSPEGIMSDPHTLALPLLERPDFQLNGDFRKELHGIQKAHLRQRADFRLSRLFMNIAELPIESPRRQEFVDQLTQVPRSLVARLLEMYQQERSAAECTLIDEILVRRELREKKVYYYKSLSESTSLAAFKGGNGNGDHSLAGHKKSRPRLLVRRYNFSGESYERDLTDLIEVLKTNPSSEDNIIELVIKRPVDPTTHTLLSDDQSSQVLGTVLNTVFSRGLVQDIHLKRVTFTLVDSPQSQSPTYLTFRGEEETQSFIASLAKRPSLVSYQLALLKSTGETLVEDRLCRGYHPLVGHQYLRLNNLILFPLRERDSLHSDVSSHIFYVEHPEKKDRRMFGRSIVSEARIMRTAEGTLQEIPEIRTRFEALLDVMKSSLQSRPKEQQPGWNQAHVEILPPLSISAEEFTSYSERLAKQTEKDGRLKGLRLQKTTVRGLIQDPKTGECQPIITEITNPTGYQFVHNLKYVVQGNVILEEGERAVKREVHLDPLNYALWKKDPSAIFPAGSYQLADQPILPRDEVGLREEREMAKAGIFAARIPSVARLSARKFRESLGIQSPQDLLDRSQSVPEGVFVDHEVEYDFDPASIRKNPKTGQIDYFSGELVPAVEKDGTPRLPGKNKAGVVVAVSYRDLGLERPFPVVMMIGDLTRNGGALDPETSARKNGALALARKLSREHGFEVTVESISASPGADVNAQTGVEHLDGIASHLGETNRHVAEEQGPIHDVAYRYVVGGAGYDFSRRTMLLDTAGLNIFVRDTGTPILTGPGAQIISSKPGLRSWEIDEQVKRSYPEGARSMGGYAEIYGRNGEGMIGVQDLSEAFNVLNRTYYYTALRKRGELVPLRSEARLQGEDFLTASSGPSIRDQLTALSEGKKLKASELIGLLQQSEDAAALNLRLESGTTIKESLESAARGQEVDAKEIIRKIEEKHPRALDLSRTVQDELISMIGNRPPWNMQQVMDAFRDPGSPPPIRLWESIEDVLLKVPPENLPTVRGNKDRIGGILRKAPNIQVRIQLFQGRPTLWIALNGALTPLDSEIYAKAMRKASLLGLPVVNLNAGNPFYMADPEAMLGKQLTWGATLQDAVSRHPYPFICVDLSSLIGGYMVSVSKQLRRPEEQNQHRIIAIRHENLMTTVRVVGANIYTNIVARGDIAKRAEADLRVRQAKQVSDEKYEEMLHQVITEIEAQEAGIYNARHTTEYALQVGAIDALVDLKDLYSAMTTHFQEAVSAHQSYRPTAQGLDFERHAEQVAGLSPEEIARRFLQGFVNSGLKDPQAHAKKIGETLQRLAKGWMI